MVAQRHTEADASFRSNFEAIAANAPNAAIQAWRQESFARFEAIGIPTTRFEPWKYTNIGRSLRQPFRPARAPQLGSDAMRAHFAGGPSARRLIFINGQIQSSFSHAHGFPEGVVVKPLSTMLRDAPDRVLDGLDADDERSFTALNGAFLTDGAWIEVPAGVNVTTPLQLLFLTVAEPAAAMCHPRIVVKLGEGSSLHLIESHIGLGGQVLTNLVTQVELGEQAVLDHDRLQLGGDGTTLVGRADVDLGRKARLNQVLATSGGGLTRNETEARLNGSGIECILNGTFLPRGNEHIDNTIRIEHRAPDSHSDQFYKGVLDDKARAVFAGKILVTREAQRTNAYQRNNNLMLTDDAEIDAKPELEIYADDVKCSHGATSSDLDEISLFYLQSRGLDRRRATAMLTYAFAGEIIDRYRDDGLKKQAQRSVLDRLPGGKALDFLE